MDSELFRLTEKEKAFWEQVRKACVAEDFDKARTIAENAGTLKKDLIIFINFTSENFCLPAEYWNNSNK